jgi:hypothetical protein
LANKVVCANQPPAPPGVFCATAVTMTITFVTTTTFGSWLPGDLRGYVRKGEILPADPELLEKSRQKMKQLPVRLTRDDQEKAFEALVAACDEFKYRLSDAAVEPWHLHWILFHADDAIEVMVGRLKTRMRQAIGRGRIWTEGYCAEPLFDDMAVQQAQEYIARHLGCRMTDGKVIGRGTPGRAGG